MTKATPHEYVITLHGRYMTHLFTTQARDAFTSSQLLNALTWNTSTTAAKIAREWPGAEVEQIK